MRRSLALYALLFAARASGVELARPPVAPVQLGFSFAAPPMIAPSLMAGPVAMLGLPGAAPMLTPVALAPAALVQLGFSFEEPARAEPPAAAAPAVPVEAAPPIRTTPTASREDEGEDGRSQLRRLARGDSSRVFNASRRATKMDYDEFGRQLARRPGLDQNSFNQSDSKRRVLAASGYTHLYGVGGVRIPIADASDVRVGNAFNSVKKTFDRRATSPPAK
jgi:hypothetical protein